MASCTLLPSIRVLLLDPEIASSAPLWLFRLPGSMHVVSVAYSGIGRLSAHLPVRVLRNSPAILAGCGSIQFVALSDLV